MKQFVHPAKDDITLAGLLGALADPMRIKILKNMNKKEECASCTEAAPCPDMAKSTLSHHFRTLRDAGLIRTEKRGVENRNTIRREEIDQRFPGLLDLVFKLYDREAKTKRI